MIGKTAKLLRATAECLGSPAPKGYKVVPHTIRNKVYREPWQKEESLPKFAYTPATLRLVPDCARARYQRAKLLYKKIAA